MCGCADHVGPGSEREEGFEEPEKHDIIKT
jgi:hypothetical protein